MEEPDDQSKNNKKTVRVFFVAVVLFFFLIGLMFVFDGELNFLVKLTILALVIIFLYLHYRLIKQMFL